MIRFKDFLLNEDLGIGPEGTIKNPSIKNYLDSLKKERKDIIQQKKINISNPEEKKRLNDLLNQKQQEILQTKLLSNPATVLKATPMTTTTSATSSLAPTTEPSAKESAFDKLIRGKSSIAPDTSASMSPGLGENPPLNVSYNVGQNLGGSMTNPSLSIEKLGKTSKSFRL